MCTQMVTECYLAHYHAYKVNATNVHKIVRQKELHDCHSLKCVTLPESHHQVVLQSTICSHFEVNVWIIQLSATTSTYFTCVCVCVNTVQFIFCIPHISCTRQVWVGEKGCVGV